MIGTGGVRTNSFFPDGNGDASRDEIEMACMDFHREQLSIEHSMQDLDSAVGRLDNILMSLYVIVAALIIAVCLVGNHASWSKVFSSCLICFLPEFCRRLNSLP